MMKGEIYMEHCTYDPAHEEAIHTLEMERRQDEYDKINPWCHLEYEE